MTSCLMKNASLFCATFITLLGVDLSCRFAANYCSFSLSLCFAEELEAEELVL